jgi:hypothetical protein
MDRELFFGCAHIQKILFPKKEKKKKKKERNIKDEVVSSYPFSNRLLSSLFCARNTSINLCFFPIFNKIAHHTAVQFASPFILSPFYSVSSFRNSFCPLFRFGFEQDAATAPTVHACAPREIYDDTTVL